MIQSLHTPVVRRATVADISVMLKIAATSSSSAQWSTEQYNDVFARMSPHRIALLISIELEVCGFLVARQVGDDWELENIVVSPFRRNRGFGSKLVAEFLAIAFSSDAKKVFLEVRESNSMARNLYEGNAFVMTGRRRGYYTNPAEDAITYVATGSKYRMPDSRNDPSFR